MADGAGIGGYKPLTLAMEKGRGSQFDYDSPVVIDRTLAHRSDGYKRCGSLAAANFGPYTFTFDPEGNTFLNLSTMYVYCLFKVVRDTGAPLTNADSVAPVNGLGTAMWERIDISIDDELIDPDSAVDVNYKSYIQTVLSCTNDSVGSHLTSQLFAMDTAGHYEDFQRQGDNFGFRTRAEAVERSRSFEMVSPIPSDFMHADTHLAPGRKLTIKFHRAKDSFVLCSPAVAGPGAMASPYKIEIEDLRVYFQRIQLRDNVPLPRTERYLVPRTQIKKIPLVERALSFRETIWPTGKLPKTIVVGFTRTSGAEGAPHRNPFYFQHANINKIFLSVNSNMVPSEPFEPNFGGNNPLVQREYIQLFLATGTYRINGGHQVSPKQFLDGCTLFAFDLNADSCASSHLHEAPSGNISVNGTFSRALGDPLTMIVFMSFDDVHTFHKSSSRSEGRHIVQTI